MLILPNIIAFRGIVFLLAGTSVVDVLQWEQEKVSKTRALQTIFLFVSGLNLLLHLWHVIIVSSSLVLIKIVWCKAWFYNWETVWCGHARLSLPNKTEKIVDSNQRADFPQLIHQCLGVSKVAEKIFDLRNLLLNKTSPMIGLAVTLRKPSSWISFLIAISFR